MLIATEANRVRLTAIDASAKAEGLKLGMNLADARALVPQLQTGPSDPAGDRSGLERLADWCGRFSPWVATDGEDGLILEITGVPHLFGGEAAMQQKVQQAITALKLGCRLAIADTPAAAWAWARYAEGGILPPRARLDHLGGLPVPALRLAPELSDQLATLGLKTIADIAKLPRSPLARRFGLPLLNRLDALLGDRHEPISPRALPAPWRSRADLAEPILTRPAIDALLQQLLDALCALLEQEHLGARQLALHSYRVDGEVQTLTIGTAKANRNPKHLFRLFHDKLDTIEPGFGIETFLLEATATDPLSAEQAALDSHGQASSNGFPQLIDRLEARLGRHAVFRIIPLDNHCPERAVGRARPLARASAISTVSDDLRPIHLLAHPELADMAGDGSAFRWRRVLRPIRHCIGPERLSAEWWRNGMDVTYRDYFRIEDEQGHRYWLYRSGEGWFVHGFFA
ncbi:Y-family DNA polymerase [Ferrovibrio sp.]|uniref:Y-family DNA polymerase n=1 Tax=Ferrovibrio sp. TaxID=1917215 RepID=UPI003D272B2D